MLLRDAARASRLEGLVALRDLLAEQIEECTSGRDLAALSLRFTDVLAQIAELSAPASGATGGSPTGVVDEFTKRRQTRAASS